LDHEIYDELYRREDSHWLFRGRRAIIRALLARADVKERPRILDAGCGTGRNLLEYSELGEASGVDSSQLAVDYCQARGLTNVRRGSLEELPFEDGEFDLLLLADVIEHVDDDVVVLRELRRVAAPGAVMIVTTPAYKWLWGSHDVSHHHKRRYTRPELLERARAASWEPTQATYFNTLLFPPIAAVRLLRRKAEGSDDVGLTPAWLDGPLTVPLQLEAALVRRGVRFPFGVSIGLACRTAPI
jgi:SAM-dependent methyltransferase